MATISDVAARAGVARSVVSRLLNADPTLRIRPATRTRILKAIRDLDYTPNATARALRLARSGALGLVVHDITNPIYGEIISGVHKAATAAGYVVLLGEATELERRTDTLRQLLASGRIDGLLLQRVGEADDAALAELAHHGLPTVLLNDWAIGDASAVSLDDLGAARLATKHLVELGHECIAHLAGADSHRSAQRQLGYEQVLKEAGLPAPDDWTVTGGWDLVTGQDGMRRLLALRYRPTAVMVANVLAAIGALAATQKAGLKVPTDISIIAIHDAWIAEYVTPQLTTVALPLARMGERAVELLLARLAGDEPSALTVTNPPPLLVLRASTAPPPGRGATAR